ncbi:MAG: universal stress protein [Nitrososphaeraceae archaeon]
MCSRYDIDLTIVGTRGMSAFTRLLLGSVASSVVTYAGWVALEPMHK